VAEAVVLAALVIATHAGREAARRREIAIGLVLIAATANLVSLGFLVHYLIGGGSARGADLLDGGVLIWATNLLLFAVLYWEHAADGARQALMAVQGLAALITTGVVVARAVSLLG